ncbi:MAG: hypothetical protein HY782_21875, partial [Chloroflexi bacterium]|nr:hypothetical protein [Chloroflexota bacterium]
MFAKCARLPRAKRTLLIEVAILLAVARLVLFRLVARCLLRQPRRLPASPQPD